MKIATVDEFVTHKVAPEHRAVVSRLRALMKKHAPHAKEGISYGILAWKMKRMIAVVNATRHHITFAFSGGAHFEDKYGLLEGVGKVSKHVKLTSLADINATALRYYIKQAVDYEAALR
jgi:uncharacterized protein YdhG (YjbR/CyaY superfamily)